MINGAIELSWGDGDHIFNVAKIAHALELEEKCGEIGIFEIFQRVSDGKARINDIRETIRLGLIGGGKNPIKALDLVKRYVDARPLAENLPIARMILVAAIVGVPGDDIEKKLEAEGIKKEATHASSAPPSTVSEPPSGLVPDKLTKSLSGSFAHVQTDGTESTEPSLPPNQ